MNLQLGLQQVIVGALIVDVLVEFTKVVFDKHFKANEERKDMFLRIISIVLGIIICFSYKIDFIATVELNKQVNFVGEFLTGILISRGSNTIHDALKKMGIKNTKF